MKKKNIIYTFVLVLFLLISIGYAALNSTLNINGKSNISKNTWDVHFDNIVVKDSSVEAIKLPTIENNTTVNFEVLLDKPGDFYEFTVDVVNNGTIDAMIESITKTPNLTETQQKYLNYIIEYQNGEQITTKQLVEKDDFVRLKVRVEYKSDITASDLPSLAETLNLSFTVNYTQGDSFGTSVLNKGKSIKIINGSLNAIGSEVAIGDEHFYVIGIDDNRVALFAKYNLHVGNQMVLSSDFEDVLSFGPIENPTKKQSSTALGADMNNTTFVGTVKFSDESYWLNEETFEMDSKYEKDEYSDFFYVYNKNSNIYNYVEDYKDYIESLGVDVAEARLITTEDLVKLGCDMYSNSCEDAPSWIYSSSYWTGMIKRYGVAALEKDNPSFGDFTISFYSDDCFGVRPVIILNYEYDDLFDLGDKSYEVGTKFCFAKECFYVISDDAEKVTMLAEYNLYAGGERVDWDWVGYGDAATGLQDSTMLGWSLGVSEIRGTIDFSSSSYWSTTNNYPAYVYNSNSEIYRYIENYKIYLENLGADLAEARLIKAEELEALGCIKKSICPDDVRWLTKTSYWTGTAENENSIWTIHRYSGGGFYNQGYSDKETFGIRPVISILK